MRATFSSLRSLLAVTMLASVPSYGADGQQTLQHVKDLYARASYEDALAALASLPAREPATEAAQYRAACLLALGRADEARKTVLDVVEAHPEYLPDARETSPRVMELFHSVRREKLPAIVRSAYAEARSAMDQSDLPRAIERFEAVVRLLGEPGVAGDATLSELKVLASGFLDLAKARVVTATPEEPKPAVDAAPPAAPPVVIPAQPISQQLPAWTPPEAHARGWQFTGSVRVEIGADGRVTSASIERPVHPTYDQRLLAAARSWRYEPARQGGNAVPSVRVVEVVLKPE